MSLHSRSLSLVVAALGFLALSGASRPVAAAVHAAPGFGPLAGPVEVSTDVLVFPGPDSTLVETSLLVTNDADEPVQVVVHGTILWPDGSRERQRIRPITLPAGGGLGVSALYLVPEDVGAGEGTYTATVYVGRIGQGGRGSFPGRLIARDSATFVLP
jgi:hypothetical protein